MTEDNRETVTKREHPFLSGLINPRTLVKASNLTLVFLHMLPIWPLKFSLQSILTPYNFSELLSCVCSVRLFTNIFSLFDNNA